VRQAGRRQSVAALLRRDGDRQPPLDRRLRPGGRARRRPAHVPAHPRRRRGRLRRRLGRPALGGGGGPAWRGARFVTREVCFPLVLMHLGTYLQGYFPRDELNRVLPVVYAGGRVGGIAGGALLEWLSAPLGALNLVPVFLGLCLVCQALLA